MYARFRRATTRWAARVNPHGRKAESCACGRRQPVPRAPHGGRLSSLLERALVGISDSQRVRRFHACSGRHQRRSFQNRSRRRRPGAIIQVPMRPALLRARAKPSGSLTAVSPFQGLAGLSPIARTQRGLPFPYPTPPPIPSHSASWNPDGGDANNGKGPGGSGGWGR